MSLASSSSSEIQLLSKSAAFAMSLGAKELFHTNLLAFLLESDDPALVSIQLAIRHPLNFQPSAGAVPQCAVWREKNSLDLVVIELQPVLAVGAARTSTKDEQDSGSQAPGVPAGWDLTTTPMHFAAPLGLSARH